MDTEKLREAFLTSNICSMCGSQRCDRAEEWLEGCPEWHKLLQSAENGMQPLSLDGIVDKLNSVGSINVLTVDQIKKLLMKG